MQGQDIKLLHVKSTNYQIKKINGQNVLLTKILSKITIFIEIYPLVYDLQNFVANYRNKIKCPLPQTIFNISHINVQ